MESLCCELKIEIFVYLETPLPLSLTNRTWYTISQDPYTRSEWLLNKYGRAHALFHAIRLGNSFLTLEVIQSLLIKKAILSRYFIQRLFLHYGKHDQRLLELKVLYNVNNVNQTDINKIHAFRNKIPPWASDISYQVFKFLMNKAIILYNIPIKGNDLELFHFLAAGPLPLTSASLRLRQNLTEIKNLILNNNFIPFPPSPMPNILEGSEQFIQPMVDEYPRRDGYENKRQLSILARAVLIHPDLIKLWKQIGYYEVCADLNDLVIEGCFIILFPNHPQPGYKYLDEKEVVKYIKTFTDQGFKVNGSIMRNVFYSLKEILPVIGDVLIKSFRILLENSVDYDIVENFSQKFYGKAWKRKIN